MKELCAGSTQRQLEFSLVLPDKKNIYNGLFIILSSVLFIMLLAYYLIDNVLNRSWLRAVYYIMSMTYFTTF